MRDNHDRLPEVIAASERSGQFFGAVAVTLHSETRQFEIGLTHDAYVALKHILQSRPFDTLPGVHYRYFFSPSYRRIPEHGTIEVHFRIEQGASGREFPFEIPESLAANLRWFFELSDFAAASHLRCIDHERKDT